MVLKGLSAYSKHANVLLKDDGEVDAFLQRALAATLEDSLSVEDLIALTDGDREVRCLQHGSVRQSQHRCLWES